MQPKMKAGPEFIHRVGSTTWSVEQKSGKAVIVRCLDQCQQRGSEMNEKSLSFVSDICHGLTPGSD